MSEGTAVPKKPTKELLEPDTFWGLIEKLLLHSTADEQRRLRHNASLSALCRGHAVSQIQRGKAPRKTKSTYTPTSKKTKVPKDSKKKTIEIFVTDKKQEPEENSKCDVSAQQTRSECSVADSDVVFVKDSAIPESERLWRFAIRNRKQKLDSESNEDLCKTVPRARSNEAIYEGLQKRLEDAKTQEDIPVNKSNKSKPKQKQEPHKTDKVKKHLCGNVTNNHGFVTNEAKNKQSKQKFKATTNSSKPVTSHEKNNAEKECHDLNRSPVHNLIKTSESEHRSASSEHFEAQKSLYDCVIKKRLTCGSQLEVFNREIINKKLNPRMVLSRETMKKYTELKTDYLNLCYQESSLRNQIAMLQAEIYMMQNKGFHKKSAAIKTITLDSKSAQLPQIANMKNVDSNIESNTHEKVLLFPRLKPPKPLSLAQQRPSGNIDQTMPAKKPGHQKNSTTSSQKASSREKCASTSFPNILTPQGVCSLYSLTARLQPPTKRQPTTLLVPEKEELEKGQTLHRLPKMDLTIKAHM